MNTSVSQAASSQPRPAYILPALAPVYAAIGDIAETLLRVVAGVALVAHGWSKIQDPLRMTGMVEGLGFFPGWFWAPALAATEFVGGLFLIVGLLTRPAALAATVVLLVTVWFHWIMQGEGYSGAELSILWSAITFYFVAKGANRHSLDHLIGRQV